MYRKDLEPGLRAWISAKAGECRREVADEIFDSGVPRKGRVHI